MVRDGGGKKWCGRENYREGGGGKEYEWQERGRQLSSRKTIRHQIEGTDATTSLTTHNRAVATVRPVNMGKRYNYCSTNTFSSVAQLYARLFVGRWVAKIRKI